MKVKELMVQLAQTNPENEVRIVTDKENTDKLYLSFDDIVDVLIYEVKEEDWSCTKKDCPEPTTHSTPEHDNYFEQLDFESDK